MILGIETATEICSVALVRDAKVISSRSVNEKNIHSERLLLLIDEVLKEKKHSLKELDGVAVSIGPGSFTGLRIGLSTAKGLAMALSIPIIAVPTLDGIAEGFRIEQGNTVSERFCSLIDAKRNEAFYALYSFNKKELQRETEYSIRSKDEIIAEAESRNATIEQPVINAGNIAILAERRRKEFEVDDISHLEPLYLRDFVATTKRN